MQLWHRSRIGNRADHALGIAESAWYPDLSGQLSGPRTVELLRARQPARIPRQRDGIFDRVRKCADWKRGLTWAMVGYRIGACDGDSNAAHSA